MVDALGSARQYADMFASAENGIRYSLRLRFKKFRQREAAHAFDVEKRGSQYVL